MAHPQRIEDWLRFHVALGGLVPPCRPTVLYNMDQRVECIMIVDCSRTASALCVRQHQTSAHLAVFIV